MSLRVSEIIGESKFRTLHASVDGKDKNRERGINTMFKEFMTNIDDSEIKKLTDNLIDGVTTDGFGDVAAKEVLIMLGIFLTQFPEEEIERADRIRKNRKPFIPNPVYKPIL